MAFTSAFFDAELVGGEYDRVYSAEKFAEYFASFIANGVFPDPSTNLQVVANNVNDMNVLVSPGMGWINGYYCKNDGSYPLAVQAASGTLNRIDSVVIGWSRTNREITTYIKTGTAASSPTAPSLTRNADLYELMLATITVNAGVTKVTQSMITDKRPDSTVCGWVSGTVQQIDTTNLFAQFNDAFQTWFADIQAQLSGDVATNLQNQINQNKTKISTLCKGEFRVGDLRSTTLDSINDSWLLCNGQEIDNSLYPELFTLRKPFLVSDIAQTLSKLGLSTVYNFDYSRGCVAYDGSTKTIGLIDYTSNTGFLWVKDDGTIVRNSNLFSHFQSPCIGFVNGYYILMCTNSNNATYIRYTDTPGGTISSATVSIGSYVTDIGYAFGQYIAVMNSSTLRYAASPGASSWGSVSTGSKTLRRFLGVLDGMLFLGASDGTLVYTTQLASGYTILNIGATSIVYSLRKLGSLYVAETSNKVFYSSSLLGSWSSISKPSSGGALGYHPDMGYRLICGNNLYSSLGLSDGFSLESYLGDSVASDLGILNIGDTRSEFKGLSGNYLNTGYGIIGTPVITRDGERVFIKGKEELLC